MRARLFFSRRRDLKGMIAVRFGVDYHERYVGKLLKKLGFSHLSARAAPSQAGRRIVEGLKKLWRGPERPFAGACAGDAGRNLV
jgi:hypothetical protein